MHKELTKQGLLIDLLLGNFGNSDLLKFIRTWSLNNGASANLRKSENSFYLLIEGIDILIKQVKIIKKEEQESTIDDIFCIYLRLACSLQSNQK